jgi:hypothetical protein
VLTPVKEICLIADCLPNKSAARNQVKIRIGTKLGLSAFAGLVLVAGMIGNQARVNRLTQESISQVSISRDLQQAALDARIKLNELISIDRDLRLARTSSEVNFVLQQLKSRAADATSAYDGAIAMAIREEDKQAFARAKSAFNEYVATAQEIARLQQHIIELRDRQLQENGHG